MNFVDSESSPQVSRALSPSAFCDDIELYGSDSSSCCIVSDSCDDLNEDSEDDIFFIFHEDEADSDNLEVAANDRSAEAPLVWELGSTLLQRARQVCWEEAENQLGGVRGSYTGKSRQTQDRRVEKEIAHHE
jgi:hypothetical protein